MLQIAAETTVEIREFLELCFRAELGLGALIRLQRSNSGLIEEHNERVREPLPGMCPALRELLVSRRPKLDVE